MFKVKVEVTGARGNTELYPCAFGHKKGDEVIFNGETVHGKLCPDVMRQLMPHIMGMMYAGPRYSHPGQFGLWKYQGTRKLDPSMEPYDGYGYRPIPSPEEPKYHMRIGAPIHSVPGMGPDSVEKVRIPLEFNCDDTATWVTFKLSPCGLTDSGPRHLPYYRRQMSIAEKIQNEPGIEVSDILSKFTDWERKEIYPVLCPALFEELLEELVLAEYVEVVDGKAYSLKAVPKK